ncbi:hypothetical protein A4U49_15135 [Acidithiobacillus ferrivorans]|nr:hypothetical protein A4U49_15135 [Acidithiobacillus ferrivorans]
MKAVETTMTTVRQAGQLATARKISLTFLLQNNPHSAGGKFSKIWPFVQTETAATRQIVWCDDTIKSRHIPITQECLGNG